MNWSEVIATLAKWKNDPPQWDESIPPTREAIFAAFVAVVGFSVQHRPAVAPVADGCGGIAFEWESRWLELARDGRGEWIALNADGQIVNRRPIEEPNR